MADQTVSFSNWNFNKRIIATMRSKRFASAKSFLVIAGPPLFADATDLNLLTPLGLVQQFGMQSQNALMRLFEMGSREPYFLRGRETNRANLTRVMYDGNSLLKAMYQNSGREFPDEVPKHAQPGADSDATTWWNLQSVLFEEPTGLYLRLESFEAAETSSGQGSLSAGNAIGAVYLEEVHVDSHQVTVDANNVLIAENVSIQWARQVPII